MAVNSNALRLPGRNLCARTGFHTHSKASTACGNCGYSMENLTAPWALKFRLELQHLSDCSAGIVWGSCRSSGGKHG